MKTLVWVQALAGPIATMIAATAATWITWVFNSRQLMIAEKQVSIADGQKRIAAGRLNFDLYKQRYAVFEAARRFLAEVVAHDHVDAAKVLKFNIETADGVFLFDDDIVDYLDTLREKVLRLRVVKVRAKAAEEGDDEEKRIRLVDLEADMAIELSKLLTEMAEKFKPYLKLGKV
jgi:hypothetical protein